MGTVSADMLGTTREAIVEALRASEYYWELLRDYGSIQLFCAERVEHAEQFHYSEKLCLRVSICRQRGYARWSETHGGVAPAAQWRHADL